MKTYYNLKNKKLVGGPEYWVQSKCSEYVPLNKDQITFYLNHKNASIEEILACELNVPEYERTLNDAIDDKLAEIDIYDTSSEVNGFYLNTNLVWLDRETRASLKNTIESSILMGRETLNIWFGDVYVTLPIETAKTLLATLELYATDCYNITAQHKVNVKAATTIEAVDNYDYTINYPEKLHFNSEL